MALRINGESISDELLQEEFQHIKNHYPRAQAASGAGKSSPPAVPDDATLRILVKENIIRKTLLRQEAERSHLTLDPAKIKSATEAFYHQQPTPSAQSSHSPPASQIQAHIELKLKIDHLLATASADINPIEERHIKSFYESNRQHYYKKERFELYYLAYVKQAKSLRSPSELAATLSPLESALNAKKPSAVRQFFQQLVQTGTETPPQQSTQQNKTTPKTKLASKYKLIQSLAPQALPHDFDMAGGYLGIKTLSELAADLAAQLGKLLIRAAPQTLLAPIILDNTVYLFYLYAIYPAGIAPLAEIRAQVHSELLKEVRERKQDLYVYKLMQKSEIIDDNFF